MYLCARRFGVLVMEDCIVLSCIVLSCIVLSCIGEYLCAGTLPMVLDLIVGEEYKVPVVLFSDSFTSLLSLRSTTSSFRITSFCFSSFSFSLKYLFASSSARVFPYLYWLASRKETHKERISTCSADNTSLQQAGVAGRDVYSHGFPCAYYWKWREQNLTGLSKSIITLITYHERSHCIVCVFMMQHLNIVFSVVFEVSNIERNSN